MDKLYDWVDDNVPSPGRQFSARRTSKLFVAVMISSILAGLPLALWQIGLLEFKQAQEERRKQEQIQKDWQDVEKAAREGKVGEATRRLLGIEGPRPKQPQGPGKKQ